MSNEFQREKATICFFTEKWKDEIRTMIGSGVKTPFPNEGNFFFFFFVALMKNWLYPCPIWFNSYIDFFSFTTKLRCSFRCNSGTMKNLHRDPRSWIIYTALLKEENGVNCCTGSAWIISSRLEHFLYIKTKKCCVIPRERIRVKFFDFRSSRKSSVRKIIFTYESKSNVGE